LSACYIDTSALAKRYVNEAGSEEVDDFLAAQSLLLVTSLTRAEMRSLLARRRRQHDFDAAVEGQVFASFLDDIRQGYLVEHELSAVMLDGAVNIIAQLPAIALRTLDALHLAAAQQLGAERLATADATMRDAAAELGLPTTFFGTG
jgi:predicted nucleic acid-binding protein